MILTGTSWTYTVNAHELEKAIQRYARELGMDLPRIVQQTFKLIIKDAIRFSPPKSRAQGRNAVQRDISRAIYLIDFRRINNFPRLGDLVQKRDVTAVEAILARMKGRWASMRVVPFNESLHTSVRDKRGRVQRTKRIATLDGTLHRRYVRKVQGHVGYTKSGWKPSAQHAGLTLPAWVSGHGSPPGSVSDHTKSTDKPYITGTHDGHTTSSIPRRLVDDVVRRRAVQMNKDVNQVLKGRASRYFP